MKSITLVAPDTVVQEIGPPPPPPPIVMVEDATLPEPLALLGVTLIVPVLVNEMVPGAAGHVAVLQPAVGGPRHR